MRGQKSAEAIVAARTTAKGQTRGAIRFTAFDAGGRLFLSAAGPARRPHSAIDGGRLRAGEAYAGVRPDELRAWLEGAGLAALVWEGLERGIDVYAVARRGLTAGV